MHSIYCIYFNINRAHWQIYLWQTVPRMQQNDKIKNSQNVLFVLCTTREINVAAGLRPEEPIVGFRWSLINLSLLLSFPLCLSLPVCLQELTTDSRISTLSIVTTLLFWSFSCTLRFELKLIPNLSCQSEYRFINFCISASQIVLSWSENKTCLFFSHS